jgi:hypothetical protein
MAKRKVAMVAPPPAKPEASKSLEEILASLGNDRPYILIATKVDHFIVHFIGDKKLSMIMQLKGKWVIVQTK